MSLLVSEKILFARTGTFAKEERLEKRKFAKTFHGALVSFAERRIIKMKIHIKLENKLNMLYTRPRRWKL